MLHITPFLIIYSTVMFFLLGTVMASFLACMGWRMCKGESVLRGRSHCDTCGHALGARDLIPILSVMAACNEGAVFTDIARLRLKESDRIEAISRMIASLGGKTECRNKSRIIVSGRNFKSFLP